MQGLMMRSIRPTVRCSRTIFSVPKLTRNLSTNIPKPKVGGTGRRTILPLGLALGITGTTLYFTNDTFKHVILTFDRVSVVTIAMVRCFSLYKSVLSTEFSIPEDRELALSKTHLKAAQITLRALEKNGGIYIKLGQHITALTYLLPREWTDTMIPLQDQCPRSELHEIDAMFKSDLGNSIEELFDEFSVDPVGVASLAQVHIAKLKQDGSKVAVKVQHPSLKEFVPIDVYMTKLVFDLMYIVFPEYPLTWLGDEMQSSIFVELDFVKEAENSKLTSQYFQDFKSVTALRIPKIIEAQPRILIMEYVPGARLDNLEYMKENGIDTSEVSGCLSHIFNNMIFTPGVGLHCDPHGGNIAIRKLEQPGSKHNFEIILYDHGLYRNIPIEMKRNYAHFWLAVLDNDVPKMREYTSKFTGIEGDQKFKIWLSAITGRSPEVALNYNIKTKRTVEEMSSIQSQLNEDSKVIEDLMDILSSMPRIVLLILKTNDLTRSLDENLQSSLGPERTFLIMANYCAKCVYQEQQEEIEKKFTNVSLSKYLQQYKSWWMYQKRVSMLFIYDFALMIKRFLSI
ncbi:ABC1 family protein MCP2 [Spathaspora sp. JA1]|nr:ABC1 family protein MCP2 [Spathaspora sp. JA1]